MADHPGHPCSPAFSWNAGMVMHVFKSNPMLRDLEHIQVDRPGMAYLFFFDKQGRCGLMHKATQAMQAHIREAFMEWISCSTHFAVNPLPLVEGWHRVVVASEQCRHWLWAKDCLSLLMHLVSQFLPHSWWGVPPSATRLGSVEDNRGNKSARSATARPQGRPPKAWPLAGGWGNSPPSSSEQGGADSDGYSTVSEAPGGWHRRRRHGNEKHLTPACLDMPIGSDSLHLPRQNSWPG